MEGRLLSSYLPIFLLESHVDREIRLLVERLTTHCCRWDDYTGNTGSPSPCLPACSACRGQFSATRIHTNCHSLLNLAINLLTFIYILVSVLCLGPSYYNCNTEGEHRCSNTHSEGNEVFFDNRGM